jgi:hypothetical protein
MNVRGRLYCKTDVEALLAKRPTGAAPNGKRPTTITLAAILIVLYGVGEFCLSIFLMYSGVVPGSFKSLLKFFPFSSSVGLIDTTLSLAPFIAGAIVFVAAGIGIISGDYLWSGRRGGAVLGFVQVALGTILAIALASFNRSPIAYDILAGVLALNVALAVFIIIGLKSLK